ncbi:hypothetical protein [Promicromonospora sukumoe]|uniref:hypothetical protein n=1 Tax=Promicromonospora sukumoe TaxID=88382 RepID=UPI0036659C58
MSAAAEVPERLEIAGTTFVRIESPEAIACWAARSDGPGDVDGPPPVSVVVEPAAAPGQPALDLAAVVLDRFAELAGTGAAYLRERLAEPEFGLADAERAALAAPEPPFEEPEAVVWDDGTWLLRFAESSLGLADPYGIGVLFEGTEPTGVEDLSQADLM